MVYYLHVSLALINEINLLNLTFKNNLQHFISKHKVKGSKLKNFLSAAFNSTPYKLKDR